MRISVVIRNRNEAEHLRYVLEALKRQKYPDFEIILVDNQSTDESVKLALDAGADVIHIDQFTYGLALNRGIEAATGEIIVILSAHSVPMGPHFLSECVKPFEDKRVAAVRCSYAGKKADSTRWLNPELLSGPMKIWDVVARGPLASGCAIRRSVWERARFDETAVAAEEKIWAMEVLNLGYLIYSTAPAFYHYTKSLSLIETLRKQNREVIAVHSYTGDWQGHISYTLKTGFSSVLKAIFRDAPTLALRTIAAPFIRTYLRLTLARNVR